MGIELVGSITEATTIASGRAIRELDRRPIGSGKPGEVTRLVQQKFFAILKGEDKRHEDWLTYL